MLTLKKDLHNFKPNHFGDLPKLLKLSECDSPEILLLACSDHGIMPEYMVETDSYQLFSVQNMATCVPSTVDSRYQMMLASIEYAVCGMHVKHAIVCGHFGCNIIKNWLDMPIEEVEDENVLDFDRNARAVVDELYTYTNSFERLDLIICEHTLFQLENLQSLEIVRDKLDEGCLRLHGWVVDDMTSHIHCYDPISGQFI